MPAQTNAEAEAKLLNLVQECVPLTARPYGDIAREVGLTEDEVLAAVRRAKEDGVLRQIGGIFDTRSLGYSSSLVAARYPADKLDEGAGVVSSHPGVSHNYKRNHSFNLWYTVAIPPGRDLKAAVELLHRISGAEATRLLPTLQLYKIGVQLDMTGTQKADEKAQPQYTQEMREKAMKEKLSADDIAAIRVLQDDLPVEPEPFAPLAKRAGISVEELLRRGKSLEKRGLMRRFSAILNHRKAGFHANAMGVWKVPEERQAQVGPQMAKFKGVSHCYLRPTYADWPYSIFTMVHARTVRDCEAMIDAIAAETDVAEYSLLYSTKEYKKIRLKYFTDELNAWEAKYADAEYRAASAVANQNPSQQGDAIDE